MPAAPLPADENERLATLVALDLLGTEPSAEFDIFPALAQGVFATPVAAISLIDATRQWVKSGIGVDVLEVPREHSFCAHAIMNPGQLLCVPDATLDPRFVDNPLVTGGMGVRFYAGMPILGPGGHALGALCVIDHRPREVSSEALEQLKRLALGVGSALRLHASIQELQKLATTDPLTGLRNRAGFDCRLRTALTRRVGTAGQAGLLFLDLDGFKAINDLFGHAGGDAALREVGHRLRAATQAQDTLARLGGDEFCILVEDVRDPAGLLALAARVHAALAQPFHIDGQCVPLRTSIGVAASLTGAGDPEALLRRADTALYDAKRAGRGVTRAAAEDSPTPLAGRTATEAQLRHILLPPGREAFDLALQPVFDGRVGGLRGFEALVRWPGPDGHTRQPADFVPVAEATGLVVQLDRWILDQACRLAAGWPAHLHVSTNLSAANFFAGDLVGDVQAVLARHGLAPGRLRLEVTETVLLCDPDRVRRTIAALQDGGVQVVLDDFGIGHASIAYLRDYAFDGLKVDRSFVSGIEADPQSRTLVRAMIEMAHALGIESTAEGVETEGQLRMLREEGIGAVQGYLLGRPMTPGDAASLIGQKGQRIARRYELAM